MEPVMGAVTDLTDLTRYVVPQVPDNRTDIATSPP
jgi:hypothetical protein